jgi:molecular chaperone GrpE (heat shock protein)
MPDDVFANATDFEIQMRSLAEQAEQIQGAAAEQVKPKTAAAPEEGAVKPPALNFAGMIKPLVQGLEALSRATAENTAAVMRLERAAGEQRVLPEIMSGVQSVLERKEKVNAQLFDALHQELKSYKDSFILEVLQKPLIRDLMALYDYLNDVHRQMNQFIHSNEEPAETDRPAMDALKNSCHSIEHIIDYVLEVMERMEVTRLTIPPGRLDKKTQRVVAVESADNSREDGHVVQVLKSGFMWQEKVLRPEDVVIKKFRDGYLMQMTSATK